MLSKPEIESTNQSIILTTILLYILFMIFFFIFYKHYIFYIYMYIYISFGLLCWIYIQLNDLNQISNWLKQWYFTFNLVIIVWFNRDISPKWKSDSHMCMRHKTQSSKHAHAYDMFTSNRTTLYKNCIILEITTIKREVRIHAYLIQRKFKV